MLLLLLDLIGTLVAATMIMAVFAFVVASVSFTLRAIAFGVTGGRVDYLTNAEKLVLLPKQTPIKTTNGWTDEDAAESRRVIQHIDFLLEQSASTKQRISRRIPRC